MKKQSLIILILILVHAKPVLATDGYFSHGYGALSKGYAGAGIALWESSLLGHENPAGLVYFSTRMAGGLAFFAPVRQYTVEGAPTFGNTDYPDSRFSLDEGTVKSTTSFAGLPVYVMPAFSYNYELKEGHTAGFSLFGNGGMNTTYETKTFDHPWLNNETEPTGVDLMQVFLSLSYSYIITEGHSIGAGPVFAMQFFESYGLEAFSGMSKYNDRYISNNGMDNSLGAGGQIGYLGRFGERFSVGAAFRTRMYMSPFEQYAGLFAEDGDFDIPANWTAGFAWQFTDGLTWMADAKQIFYSSVASVGNPMNADGLRFNMAQEDKLGNDGAAGFGWSDMTVLKTAFDYQLNEMTSLRAGYSHCNQPIPGSAVMFNMLAPAVIEDHISIGASHLFGETKVNLAITHALNNTVSGPNPMDENQKIILEMYQWDVALSVVF